MNRILFAVILSSILVGISLISDGFGDATQTLETWVCAFILPIWSIGTISLWHDVGRLFWTKLVDVDSKTSTVSNDIRSLVFIGWMSVIMTYIFWVHLSLYALPLLLVIPILGLPFRELLLQDWNKRPIFTREHSLALAFWAASSYFVYWLLTIVWILIRVWCIDIIDNGVVYFIQ